MSTRSQAANGPEIDVKKSIALIGFMGSGKTTVGPLLAESLGVAFVDLDEVAVERAGMSVEEVFAAEGEAGWRRQERDALLEVVEDRPLVLGCGGGVVLSQENRRTLQEHYMIVYLSASTDTLAKRLAGSTGRPLLDVPEPKKQLERLSAQRLSVYEGVADIIVSTDARAPSEIAIEIVDRMSEAKDGVS